MNKLIYLNGKEEYVDDSTLAILKLIDQTDTNKNYREAIEKIVNIITQVSIPKDQANPLNRYYINLQSLTNQLKKEIADLMPPASNQNINH